MAVKLHRCSCVWFKVGGHPCWKIEKALEDLGIEYERAIGPLRRGKRDEIQEHTGQRLYPAIELEDGSWYREESKDMEKTIRDGKLMDHAQGAAAPASG
ncbi:MAG TPA: hypothetical protein VIL98_05855 [Gaiellaceae bacterium]